MIQDIISVILTFIEDPQIIGNLLFVDKTFYYACKKYYNFQSLTFKNHVKFKIHNEILDIRFERDKEIKVIKFRKDKEIRAIKFRRDKEIKAIKFRRDKEISGIYSKYERNSTDLNFSKKHLVLINDFYFLHPQFKDFFQLIDFNVNNDKVIIYIGHVIFTLSYF